MRSDTAGGIQPPPARAQPLRDQWEQFVRGDPAVTGTALAVLLTMATYGDRNGASIRVGVDRLTGDVGVSAATVRRAIDAGRRIGYLERVTRGHHITGGVAVPSEYALRLKPTAHGCALRSEPTAHAGRVGGEPTAQTTAANRSNEPSQPLTSDALPVMTSRDQAPRAHARDARPDGDNMTDRPEPLDEALATFGTSHPGREREALRVAVALYERRYGRPCTNPAGYFGAWTTAELQDKIRLPEATNRCPDCNDEGWVYDTDDPNNFRKCAHPRKAAVA